MGHFGHCANGACPLTSTWWRGALYGGVLAAALYYASGQNHTAAMNRSGKNVALITESQFDAEVLRSSTPVVVEFYASWCGPCRALAPLLDELAGPLSGKVKFVKINADASPGLGRQFHIEALPTLLAFRQGKLVDQIVGMPETLVLKSWLEAKASPPN